MPKPEPIADAIPLPPGTTNYLLIAHNDATGQFMVSGPIDNFFLCMGLLKGGEVTVIGHNKDRNNKQSSIIAAPAGAIPPITSR